MRKDRCLYPGCMKEESSRGNCGTHYWVAYDICEIKKERTWEDLERAGLIKPKRRKARDYFLERSAPPEAAPKPIRERTVLVELSDGDRQRLIEQLRGA